MRNLTERNLETQPSKNLKGRTSVRQKILLKQYFFRKRLERINLKIGLLKYHGKKGKEGGRREREKGREKK